jgi:hypothetical protein
LVEREILWKAWKDIFDPNNAINVHKVFESSPFIEEGEESECRLRKSSADA